MTDWNDADLLRKYAEEDSEAAFAELVRRHLDAVYAAAVRQVGGDAHLAKDVAQLVFTAVARKATALSNRTALGGWLCRATQFAARDLVRAERRRRVREQEMLSMNEPSTSDKGEQIEWDHLRPVIDQSLSELGESDRGAVWLRFFERRSYAEIGARLQVSENTARMRVERALEKLRRRLVHRGITTASSAAVAGALANHASAAAPAGLAASITTSALASAGAGGGTGATLFLFSMSKIKTGVIGAALIAVTATTVYELRANRNLRAELTHLQDNNEEVVRLTHENRRLLAELARPAEAVSVPAELVEQQHRIEQLKARPAGVVEGEVKPIVNAGRATPEAAMQTFCWAFNAGNLDAIAEFIVFRDDSPENRAAFLDKFGESFHAKHGTPEKYCASLLQSFPSATGKAGDAVVALQVLSVRQLRQPNQIEVHLWFRTASGLEGEAKDRMQLTERGWAVAPFSLAEQSPTHFAVPRVEIVSGGRKKK